MAGQTAKLGTDGPWVEFLEVLEVVEDSRCPLDVVCVWEGRARVKIALRFDAQVPGFQEITLEVGNNETDAGLVSGASGSYLIEAAALDPYPRTTAPKPPAYTLTLTVTETS